MSNGASALRGSTQIFGGEKYTYISQTQIRLLFVFTALAPEDVRNYTMPNTHSRE